MKRTLIDVFSPSYNDSVAMPIVVISFFPAKQNQKGGVREGEETGNR